MRPEPRTGGDAGALAHRFLAVRGATEALCAGLSAEDCLLQSMPDASPVKWHLAHTTWFLETFVLGPAGVAPLHPGWAPLFNSYYVAAGPRHARARRGDLSRPPLEEVQAWRRAVTQRVVDALQDGRLGAPLRERLVLGIAHEEQHQELIVTDLKHHFHAQPLTPMHEPAPETPCPPGPSPMAALALEGGLVEIGHPGAAGGFAFDNEGPRHRVWLEPYAIADRLVTETEYLAFIQDGGYGHPTLWLSDGWAAREAAGWAAPLYWSPSDAGWRVHTWSGWRAPRPDVPVCHLSHFEADAFARWAGARLPTEFEWEHAAAMTAPPGGPAADEGRFLEQGCRHPGPAAPRSGARQWLGEVWQWTSSAYGPYPGFRAENGALGEYNGKFMSGQMVLRGASVATPRRHARLSYRNFFPPAARWQFSGLRLAWDGATPRPGERPQGGGGDAA